MARKTKKRVRKATKKKANARVRKRSARAGANWRKSAVGTQRAAKYTGRKTMATLADKTKAAARKGEGIQTAAALMKYLDTPLKRDLIFSSRNGGYDPAVQSMVHKFMISNKFELTPVAGPSILTPEVFRLNSVNDPWQSGAGNQPIGHDLMAARYENYIVTKCEFKATFYNLYRDLSAEADQNKVKWIVLVGSDATSFNSAQDQESEVEELEWLQAVQEQLAPGYMAGSGKLMVGNMPKPDIHGGFTNYADDTAIRPGKKTISGTWSLARNESVDLYDTQPADGIIRRSAYMSLADANPVNNQKYLLISAMYAGGAWPTASSMDNKIMIDVELIYHCTWFRPRNAIIPTGN